MISDASRPGNDPATVVVFHHPCSDGMAAAAAAFDALGASARYVGATHGAPSLPAEYFAGKHVYFLDFCYPRPVMLQIGAVCRSLTVLDHHATAIRDLADVGDDLPPERAAACRMLFDAGRSGAMLAWNHFHPDRRDDAAPVLVRHVQDHDLWALRMPGTRAFCRRLRTCPFTICQWAELLGMDDKGPEYQRFLIEGQAQQAFFERQVDAIVDELAIPVVIAGQRGLAANAGPEFSCDVGDRLAQLTGAFGMTWHLSRGMVRCSLRGHGGFDVERLAGLFGGGGHQRSAGFRLPGLTDLHALIAGSAADRMS